MPAYMKIVENWTIAANTSLWGYWINWENIAGVGPNFGPLMVCADPQSHQRAEVDLVVFDVAKCRRAPGASGSTEVFYQFGVHNKSNIDAKFDLELITFKDLMP